MWLTSSLEIHLVSWPAVCNLNLVSKSKILVFYHKDKKA